MFRSYDVLKKALTEILCLCASFSARFVQMPGCRRGEDRLIAVGSFAFARPLPAGTEEC